MKNASEKNITRKITRIYEFFWDRNKSISPAPSWHFDKMQETINEPIVRGSIGIDIGSGFGYDTYIMAKNDPSVKIISMDIGKGVFKNKKLTSDLKNVRIIKCSVLDIPFKDKVFDFAYSYGVIHHTTAPQKALSEIKRILKKESPAFLYLYEDHAENPPKYIAAKIMSAVKIITTKIPIRILYGLSLLLSPIAYILFSIPSKILRNFKSMQNIADKIPFNFGSGPFSLQADICETLAVPIEIRFSKRQLRDMFAKAGFCKINIAKMKDTAGWVISGYAADGRTKSWEK